MPNSDYSVKLSPRRTIIYSDLGEEREFALDFSEKGGQWVVLNHDPPQWPRDRHYYIAFSRCKEFLESRGFNVEIDGQNAPIDSVAENIVSVKYKDSEGMILLHFKIDAITDDSTSVAHFLRADVLDLKGVLFDAEVIQEPGRLRTALKEAEGRLLSRGYHIKPQES